MSVSGSLAYLSLSYSDKNFKEKKKIQHSVNLVKD